MSLIFDQPQIMAITNL